MTNPFFKNYGPITIKDIYKVLKIKKDIAFFHSNKYKFQASITKAGACITTKNLQHILPSKCEKIIVENVLISTAKVTEILYPDSINDDFDTTVKEISKTKFKR